MGRKGTPFENVKFSKTEGFPVAYIMKNGVPTKLTPADMPSYVGRFDVKKVSISYCNAMRIPTALGGHEEIVCGDVDDYVKYEQYRSELVNNFEECDLKVEAKQYGNVIVLERKY